MTLSKSGLILFNRRYFLPSQLDFLGLSKESVYACTQETWLAHSISLVQSHQSNYLFPWTWCFRIAQQSRLGFVIFRSCGSDQQVKHAFCDPVGFPICPGSCRWCVSTELLVSYCLMSNGEKWFYWAQFCLGCIVQRYIKSWLWSSVPRNNLNIFDNYLVLS